MVALIDEDSSTFFEPDHKRFSSALTMTTEEEDSSDPEGLSALGLEETFLAVSGSNASTTLKLSHINKNSPQSPAKGILSLMSQCIREISLSYSLLSDELLGALSNGETLHLQILRVEAHPDMKPTSGVSSKAWVDFANHLPNVNLVLLTYLTEAKDYEGLLEVHVPLTHLYFGECAPTSAIARVGECCPRLAELVIGAYGPDPIDKALLSVARGCPKLAALGLGDCELTCSSLVEFVGLCCERLRVLYVLDTSLLDDSQCDVVQVAVKVSALLGKSWQPNYVPY